MKRLNQKMLVGAVLAALGASGAAQAELSGNIGAVSNYLWRGVTQTADGAAVQGGVDYSAGGFYAGAWTSNLANSGDYELDLYAGYKLDLSGVALDVGVISYMYPVETVPGAESFNEVYVGAGLGAFSAKVSFSDDANLDPTVDESSTYVELNYSHELASKAVLGLHVGHYSGDAIDTAFGDAYLDFGVTLAKDEFTFGLVKNDIDDSSPLGVGADDPRVFVQYKKSFGL